MGLNTGSFGTSFVGQYFETVILSAESEHSPTDPLVCFLRSSNVACGEHLYTVISHGIRSQNFVSHLAQHLFLTFRCLASIFLQPCRLA